MERTLSGIDSIVIFRNSQGADGRGTLVHITRRTLVFEVYNPYSIVQISEVLQGVRVLRGERTIYNGRAVVSSIVTTGLMVIVSATLVDPWADLSGLVPGKGLQVQTERFVKDWEASQAIRPSYQISVSTIRNFFEELSRWLEEAEAGVFDGSDSSEVESLKNEFYEEVRTPVGPKVSTLFEEFESEASHVPPEELMAHKAFARRELHPLTLCSPFVHRTYSKPLGYAGDYEMVNMMLMESDAACGSTYAKIVDAFHIQTAAPEAHRNRIVMLKERLAEEARRVTGEGRPFTVLNVGCGPAVEVQRFIREDELSGHSVFQLMDFNDETIEYANRKIQAAVQESGRKPLVKFIHKSIDALLKEAHEKSDAVPGSFEMVYCAGLFDYLTDQTCQHLVRLFFSWLRPGGLLTVTNVHRNNPNQHLMEHLLEWHLIYRNENDMASLAPSDCVKRVLTDNTGVNVFLDIRK